MGISPCPACWDGRRRWIEERVVDGSDDDAGLVGVDLHEDDGLDSEACRDVGSYVT